MEEEPVALVGVVALETVAGTRVAHLLALELDWRTRHIARRVETHCGRPAAWHVVVAQRYVRQGHPRLVRVGVAALLRWHTWRYAVLAVVLLHTLLHLHQTLLVVFLARSQVEAVHAEHVVEVTTAHLAGYALRAGIVVLGEAVVVNDEVRRHIQRVVVRIVVVQPLLGPVDVHTFHRSVAPDGARARVVVGVAGAGAVAVGLCGNVAVHVVGHAGDEIVREAVLLRGHAVQLPRLVVAVGYGLSVGVDLLADAVPAVVFRL